MAGPNSDAPAATRPSRHRRLLSSRITPSAVQVSLILRSAAWPSRRRWLATARGRFLEMQKWAYRRAAAGYGHARDKHAIWRLRSGAHVILAHLASRNKRASPRAKSRGCVRGCQHSPAGRHKSADEMSLLSALQRSSTRCAHRHGARTGGPIQTAPGCA